MILSFNNYEDAIFNNYENDIKLITEIVFKKFGIKNNYIVEINLINNKKIREINHQYRKINKITDVLSFSFLEVKKKPIKNVKIPQILGEIDISMPKVKQQAKKQKHSVFYEFCYLYVHGLLHLLGFNHAEDNETKIMFNEQKQILKKISFLTSNIKLK